MSSAWPRPVAGPTSPRWGPARSAGSSLPLDPERTAADLGFSSVFDNSLDAVADRDFVADALFALAAARACT